ncbi:hypothetical protein [Mesorhizobium hawassense]|uniref:hypothetical protein n=1 Tax=Mesorhizobium hawassense TaxID=1209954 RepID=UPI00142E63DB|nr:hypothetical protein [Mesorhizobium hawassense]
MHPPVSQEGLTPCMQRSTHLHADVSEAVVLVTGLMFACNATETVIDHLDRHNEGGGDCLRHSLGEQDKVYVAFEDVESHGHGLEIRAGRPQDGADAERAAVRHSDGCLLAGDADSQASVVEHLGRPEMTIAWKF